MKIFKLKAFVAFVLVLQIAFVSPFSTQQHVSAVSNTITEKMIHQFDQNTWAYSNLVNSPSGDLYLSHVKNSTAIAIKKWEEGNWKEITAVSTTATGDTGFSGPSDIAIDANNNIYAAFLYYKGSGVTSHRGVEYGVYKNGSWSYQMVEGYSDPNGWKNISNPSIAIDSNGKAHIVYVYNDANDPRKYEIHYATNQSGSWTTKTIVSGASAIDEVKDPQIEVDQNNTIHITYVKEDNQNDYYGNYYYTYKKTTDSEFSSPEKIVDAVKDQKDYRYTPFVVDFSGKIYFSYYEGNSWANDIDNETFTTHFQTNQSGTWKQEVVYTDQNKITYPVKVNIKNSKPILLMYSESKDWPPSQIGFFALVKDGDKWSKGTKEVSPSLINSSPSEITYAIDANENFMVVMLDNDLRKISYLSGTSEDFGLVSVSSNADLNNLTLSSGTLTPGFSAGTLNYTANVDHAIQTIQVTPTVADAKATVKVNGNSVASGTSVSIPLMVGSNTITVFVTAEDGTTVKPYTLNLTRKAPSSNADLSKLTVSAGTLSPAFNPSIKQYNVSVPNGTDQIRLTPTVADSYATVTVGGNPVTSGQESGLISLGAGKNSIPIVVTAQDGTTATYTVLVNRNRPPAATDTTFTVDENAPTGTTVGTITASDLDSDSLTYSILSGNSNHVFELNSATGEIKVADGSLLDYETTQSYTLAIQVSDGLDKTTVTVKINVNDLNDNSPVPKGFTTTVDENLANGTSIGTVTATDADAGSRFTYKITAGNTEGAFAIGTSNGEITVADSTKLDYETVKSFTLTVQVSDGMNTADTTVTIHLNNLNDNTPVVKDAVFTVDENAAIGTFVGTVIGSDADGDPLSYRILSGNESGAFAINATTGDIIVADGRQLDYETKTSYELKVQVSDTITPNGYLTPYALLRALFANSTTETDIATITINVNDLNDNSPVPQGFTKNIDENTANGTSVGNVTATDADAGSSFTYKITSGNSTGAFEINENSGEVTVADETKLDYETVKSFTLTVQVSDGANTADTTVTINLNNLNDNTPVAKDAVFSVDENAANGTFIGTVSASDADGDPLTFRILSGNETGTFKIDAVTGEITVADGSQLDYETKTSYQLKVQASDTIVPNGYLIPFTLLRALFANSTSETDIATITINVNDLNDNSPVPQGFTKNIDENTVIGTSVGTVTATDADAGSSFTYKIIAGNAAGAFAIDSFSGEITVVDSTKLDYEVVKSFTLTIQVSDGKNTGETSVTINLNNLNDNTPVAKDAAFTIDENAANGTVVGTVTASDADGDPLTYRIISGNESAAFAIDATTGKITVADSSKLDYETIQSFTLKVQVSDGTYTADTRVTINLNNLNDNTPVTKDTVFTIDENAANGTEIGTVMASDDDGDTLSYRVIGGNDIGAFAIDATTGKITVADSGQLDYEKIKSFTLTVQVSDGTHSANSTVTIQLNNLNDNTPVAKDAVFTVDEKAANGTAVGTVTASDADGDAVTYTITSGNDDGIFTINETTGVITVANASRLHAATKAMHTLSIRASDGQHAATITVTVHVLSSDATLSQLTSSNGNLNPEFKPGTTQYSMNVGDSIHTIKLTPTIADSNATVKINGKQTTSGQESEVINLGVGKNTITIEVTAQNGQTTTYIITVTRLQSVVTTVPVKDGGTVTVSDEQVNLIDDNGTLIVELKNSLDEVKTIKFTAGQLETLINKQAMIQVVKDDVQLLIPAVNFAKGEDLIISLERVGKNPKKLPSSNLAISAVYEFTIKQGDKIIHHFDHDIELVFPTDNLKVDHPEELKVYYWNEDKKEWELVGGTFENGQLRAKTNHFSTFAVFHPNDLKDKKPSPESGLTDKKPSPASDLPNTATTMYNWLFAGILVVILGGALFLVQRLRQKDNEIL
ncbi:cadherin domain-containing protein [Neobacillus sp.]|uniref:cadherin domain-containing protein n=1 Tax=Neobacillus sp. TaxID=2675273 RepID=UPI00289E9BCA|nr:cadherin domain-containing protein [Neobacillus sp.]